MTASLSNRLYLARMLMKLCLGGDGWELPVFCALTPLTDADLDRRVTIRGEPHSVMQAINRQVAHYSYHVGQRISREATAERELEVAECAAEQVLRIQSEGGGRRSEPAIRAPFGSCHYTRTPIPKNSPTQANSRLEGATPVPLKRATRQFAI